jgi:hypothetical protein
LLMEKTEDRSNPERANHDEHDLAEELEALYCRVARLDQPDAPVSQGDTHGNDPLFKDLPRRTVPDRNPSNPEELMEKLMAIRDAYERLLTSWPFARECPPPSPFREASPEISIRNATPDGK